MFPASMMIRTGRRSFTLSFNSPIDAEAELQIRLHRTDGWFSPFLAMIFVMPPSRTSGGNPLQYTFLEHFRAFLKFCQESDWIRSNPATKLKPGKVTSGPTLPFSRAEFDKILAACDK